MWCMLTKTAHTEAGIKGLTLEENSISVPVFTQDSKLYGVCAIYVIGS